MPDYGRPGEDLEQRLEQEITLAIYPALDYGSTLLARGSPSHPPSGGRKLNGGIMMRTGYKGPTVNIRPPKWTDNTFWIGADNYPDAQYIADAVYYHIGRGPFHFVDANFQYPPLRLATRELLTRESCSGYVESIAKGPANQKQREDYKERVKELVLKAVKSPEAILFLSSLRPSARPETNFEPIEADDSPHDGIDEDSDFSGVSAEEVIAEEVVGSNVGDEFGEQGTPMEVDHLTERAIQALVPCTTEVVSEPVALSGGPAYIPTFGIASSLNFPLFDSGCILGSDLQSLDDGWNHSAKKAEWLNTFFGDLEDLLRTLDREEEESWRSTEGSDWMGWRPQHNA